MRRDKFTEIIEIEIMIFNGLFILVAFGDIGYEIVFFIWIDFMLSKLTLYFAIFFKYLKVFGMIDTFIIFILF